MVNVLLLTERDMINMNEFIKLFPNCNELILSNLKLINKYLNDIKNIIESINNFGGAKRLNFNVNYQKHYKEEYV